MKIIIAALLLIASTASLAEKNSDPFQRLMQEAELSFTSPDGFTELPPGSNAYLDYEQALRSDDGKLEVRLSVRPIKRIEIDYDDPHSSAPNPNHIFPLAFESLTGTLSGGNYAPSNEYSAADAHKNFNADWAALSAFNLTSGYPSTHRQALFLAIHRNRVADAYLLLLYDDYEGQKTRIKEVMQHLRFMNGQPVAQAGSGKE